SKAEFDTTDWIASVESRFVLSSSEELKIEPVVSLGRYIADYRSFKEQGVGPLGLIVDGRVMSWWRGRVALEATGKPWSFGSSGVRPRASLAWVNDFSPVERTHTGRLQGAPDNPFT